MLHRPITGEQQLAFTGMQNIAPQRIKCVFKVQQIVWSIVNCPIDIYIRHRKCSFPIVIVTFNIALLVMTSW